MNRDSLRNALLTACALALAGCGTDTSKTELPAAASPQSAANAATGDYAATLDQEIAQAHELRVKGDLDQASRALGQLMLVAPDDGRVMSEYGKLLVQKGQPREALPFLQRAQTLHSTDWSIYSAIGVAYDQIDQHGDARHAYDQALALHPGAPEVLNNYAVSRMLTGDLDGAQKLLAEAGADNDPKLQGNLAMLARLRHSGRATALADAAPAPPPSSPVQPANRPAAPTPTAQSASGAPHALQSGRVVMEKVPTDPLAGPVARKHVPAHGAKLAHNSAHKPAPQLTKDAPVGHPPMLRTAAGGP